MNLEDYFRLVEACTPEPTKDKTVWAKGSKVCLVYIEPRPLSVVKHNLWNICNVYGGSNVDITLLHSSHNKDMILSITRDWENVRCIVEDTKLSSVDEYSRFLASVAFWDLFSEYEYVCIHQWDSYIFKKIPEKFFAFDFVGAPTGHFYVPFRGGIMNICHERCTCDRCLVGDHYFKERHFIHDPNIITMCNGGLSLRKVSAMRDVCTSKQYRGEPEDLYFCLHHINKPSREEAKEFSVQDFTYDGIPFGCHKIWESQQEDYIKRLFET